jgi:cellulose biosynthesis protein BcsQ
MNNKGGCGKTGFADAFLHWLIQDPIALDAIGFDCDSQCNLSQRFGILSDNEFIDRRINDFYHELSKKRVSDKSIGMPLSLVYPHVFSKNWGGTLGLLAGSTEAELSAGLAMKSLGASSCISEMKKRLDIYSNYYDYIVMDTAPAIHNNSVNELTVNVVDEIIIPFDSNEAVFGLSNFIDWISKVTYDKKPNITFIMTKFQPDTVDITGGKRRKTNTLEHKCAMYDLMKSLLGDFVCDTGIPERRILRSHSYLGLRKSHPLRKRYDKLCEEVYKKINDPNRENLLDYWAEHKIKDQLSAAIEPLESKRNRGIQQTFGNFSFRDLRDIKKDL